MISGEHIVSRYEIKIFSIGLALTIFLSIARLVHNLIIGATINILIINLSILSLLSIFYFLRNKHLQLISLLTYSALLAYFLLVWNSFGGWNGPALYYIFGFAIFIILSSHGKIMWFSLSSIIVGFCALVYFSQVPPSLPASYTTASLVFDFSIITAAIVFTVYYLKTIFFKEKKKIESGNVKLIQATKKLKEQVQLLKLQTRELNLSKEIEEQMIRVTFNELQESNNTLKQYSFINSHIIRAPISNVLGLIDLIETQNPSHPEQKKLSKIKNEAIRIDSLIRDVSSIINHKDIAQNIIN